MLCWCWYMDAQRKSSKERSMQKQKTWGRGQIIKFEAGRDASQVQQWGVCMLDAWAWDDKDQQTMQPATTPTSVRQLTWRQSYIALLCRRFCHNDSPRREFAWWKKTCLICPVRCRCSGWRLEWRLPTTIGQGHTGEISLYSVLSLA